jgi:molecular chaperone DnaK
MRGIPQIEVTFDIDANGILNVSAKDKATNKSQQIRIEASSGLSEEEIKRMKAEAEANAETDRKQKEEIDKLNHADSMVFQTEKQLKEYGDKLPADKKQEIESILSQLKTAHAAKDIAGIDAAMTKMNELWQQASQQMYSQGQQPGAGGDPFGPNGPFAQGGAPNPGGNGNTGQQPPTSEGGVEDADFEEVK